MRTHAEDLTVDRHTEEPLMFLFARVQSQKSRLSFGYTQTIIIELYIFPSHNQSSFTYFREYLRPMAMACVMLGLRENCTEVLMVRALDVKKNIYYISENKIGSN